MSLEENMERIAVALETLAQGGGIAAGAKAEPEQEVSKEEDPDPMGLFDEAETEAPVYTITDIRKSLAALVDKKGETTAIETLGKFGAKKLSDIKESDYATFIKTVAGVV